MNLYALQNRRASFRRSQSRAETQRQEMLAEIRQHGPMTGNDIHRLLPAVDMASDNVRARLCELEKSGEIVACADKIDAATGHKNTVYRLREANDPEPAAQAKPPTRKQLAAELEHFQRKAQTAEVERQRLSLTVGQLRSENLQLNKIIDWHEARYQEAR